MKNTIIVWYQEDFLLVSKSVAKKLGLTHDQKIKSEEEFNKILIENASHNIEVCNHAINANKRVN